MVDAGLAPDPWQERLLRADAPRALLLCARQTGKSTATAFLALKAALLEPGTTVLVISQSLSQSSELLRKVTGRLDRLGRPAGVAATSATKLELGNGSRVLSLPGSEATIRGFSAGLLIVDEAARVQDALLAGVRPMLAATGGRFVALSTAFARRGWFHALWTGGGAGWLKLSVTARDCPRISPDFLAEEERVLGRRWFAMEYLNEFQDDVAAVFGAGDVRAALTSAVTPLFVE
jgi:hypothetical protein